MSPIVSGGAGGGSGIGAVLFDSTLGADTASIDTGAAGIAQTQNILEVLILARTDEAVVNSTVVVTLNNDATAIYDRILLQGQNVTASVGNLQAQTGWVFSAAGASQAAGVYTPIELRIPAYAQTTAQKAAQSVVSNVGTAAANTLVIAGGWNYRSTTAISRLKVANAGGTVLKAGSRLLILGR